MAQTADSARDHASPWGKTVGSTGHRIVDELPGALPVEVAELELLEMHIGDIVSAFEVDDD